MFLAKTVENILENIEGNTEIIVVLDGAWANPSIPQNERVTIVYNKESIGQRAATNQACKLSKSKYVMKVDAHCAFDKGFDVKMINEMHDDWTMVPLMKNLHAFDWVCPQGHRRYQGPSGPCMECGMETKRDILWHAKDSPKSVSYCFDSTPHFQYFGDYAKRPEGQGDITETMSLQGSCWMLTRNKYWELNVCDEEFGSWGSQGIEVAAKTWLSGGRVMVNKKTWYAHMFRTQGGDFGFPYPLSGRQTEKAKDMARDLFFNDKWPKQIHPLSWLIEKFWPVKGWTEEDLKKLKANTFKFSGQSTDSKPAESEPTEDLSESGIIYSSPIIEPAINISVEEKPAQKVPTKGIIYYTDNQLKLKIAVCVQKQLAKIGLPIVSASLKPMNFGKNIHVPLKRGVLTMFKQILTALENSDTDIVYFCEADVLYHPSHFDFTPPEKDVFYYNENVWKIDAKTGHALHYDCKQVSGIAVYREAAVKHYRKRVEMVEANGFNMSMGYEPGTHHRPERVDDATAGSWKSEFPNLDIRHDGNFSPTRWSKDEFRNQRYTQGWIESDDEVPGWGKTKDWVAKFN
jgi:glycosyltransferase involved in cell wall biosynthesis